MPIRPATSLGPEGARVGRKPQQAASRKAEAAGGPQRRTRPCLGARAGAVPPSSRCRAGSERRVFVKRRKWARSPGRRLPPFQCAVGAPWLTTVPWVRASDTYAILQPCRMARGGAFPPHETRVRFASDAGNRVLPCIVLSESSWVDSANGSIEFKWIVIECKVSFQ